MSAPLTLHIRSDVDWKGLPAARSFRQWIELALKGANRRRAAEVNVLITDADTGRALNRDFRGKDYATNVLSFPTDLPPEVKSPLIGDLAICAPVVAREAEEQGKRLRDHYAHMVIHGTLHLLGHDHVDDHDAERMEALETRLLAALGIADPYAAID
ncbi:MAG: rRNA maturation RNase YbeY [Rhodanobacteraceae bacterium]|nr:rRNA maturation RNase YbeY [Rhodanobacteraceae bacterium]